MTNDAEGKAKLMLRLARIEGQVRGLARMVESDGYCVDVLTQITASTRALQAVALQLLQGHLKHCIVEAADDHEALDAKIREVNEAIARLVRS